MRQVTRSNVTEGNGRHSASATTKSIFPRRCSRDRARASRSISGGRPEAITLRTPEEMAPAVWPPPVATSRTTWKGSSESQEIRIFRSSGSVWSPLTRYRPATPANWVRVFLFVGSSFKISSTAYFPPGRGRLQWDGDDRSRPPRFPAFCRTFSRDRGEASLASSRQAGSRRGVGAGPPRPVERAAGTPAAPARGPLGRRCRRGFHPDPLRFPAPAAQTQGSISPGAAPGPDVGGAVRGGPGGLHGGRRGLRGDRRDAGIPSGALPYAGRPRGRMAGCRRPPPGGAEGQRGGACREGGPVGRVAQARRDGRAEGP